MTAAVAVAGISGTGTPAHLRERLAVTPENAGGLSRSLAASAGEAVVLTTCNRTEVYLAAMDAAEARTRARGHWGLSGVSRLPSNSDLRPIV